MKKLLRTIAIILLCGVLAAPLADAGAGERDRGRGRHGSGGGTHQPASRPGGSHNRGHGGEGHHRRPGQSGRPGVGTPSHGRPSHGGQHHTPPPRPMGHHGHWHHRPDARPPRPFFRPAPPPRGWRPYSSWHPFNTFLGVTLGSAFNITLNTLVGNGYVVTSHTNDVIYLDNVRMLDMWWPDAAMFFNGAGQLYGSRFIYSSAGYDMNRYYTTYNLLTRNYGQPVAVNNGGNSIEATWWGPGNQYITLTYAPDYSSGGYMRYYTTLSLGI